MANPFANAAMAQLLDGIIYSNLVPLTNQEVDLSTQATPYGFDPLPVKFGQAFHAGVLLTTQGSVPAETCYIVAQTGNDNVNWIDLAWIVSTITTGSQYFVLTGGGFGNNALQQTRAVNTAPGSSGSNAIPLGGLLRFVGRTTLGSSSSPSGTIAAVLATITCKILGLR